MNGVDHKDQDTADWTVLLKSNRFYLRIFYWLFDSVLHTMYTVIKVVASDKSHPWHKYLGKHPGRFKFQMDLAVLELISQGITMDWSDIEDINNKPGYIREEDYLPCACKVCFFCTNGLRMGSTTRIEANGGLDRTGQSAPSNESACPQPHCR
jgi:hypothetical protein